MLVRAQEPRRRTASVASLPVTEATARRSQPGGLDDHPCVRAALRLAAGVLAPQAEQVDVEGVPASHVEALAGAGLLGLYGPADAGGSDVPAPVARRVTEVLSGADGATWFVWTQHATPVRALTRSGNAELRRRWLPRLCRDVLGGIAMAHLRRSAGPTVRACAGADGGWRLDGTASWVTSWGLAEVLLVGAVTDDDRAVSVLVAAHEQPGLVASQPLALAAMGATSTVRLELDGLVVPAGDVVDVEPLDRWRRADADKTANVTPAVFGLIDSVVAKLEAAADRRGEPAALALARALAEETGAVRAAAYRLLDEVPAREAIEERLALRGHALELGVRAATALVVTSGGAGMSRSSPAQRLAREALFHLVQAQTPPVRRATLARLAEVGGRRWAPGQPRSQ
ncbi:MAG: acyl-CoA/acyl-ACP dehydrogenase [Actinobacteria bacterium]|nr:acyl-CoA/acyl-ACP dehydrogenase [Actinomycetota bacterium]